ncbi:MAG: sulfate permease [Paracoccus sp. (in: a-proteobacteria)]|nr:sulfate permease [Paracoccus sp. (in: a-proteobacteria)]
MRRLSRYLPPLVWMRGYGRDALADDLLAAAVVVLMLIPQSLAYALLAGMPPEAGIYASILPVLIYAMLGTSPALAVGPVAVISLMSAAAIGNVAAQGTAGYVIAALTLAALSGLMLLAMGLLRLGMIANFLSHPVISGFITASALLIAAGQLRHILGAGGQGDTLPEIVAGLWAQAGGIEAATLLIGTAALGFLVWVRRGMGPALRRAGLSARTATLLTRAGPVLAIIVTTFAVWALGLDARVATVGEVPRGLPPLTLPSFAPELIAQLWLPAAMISLIGFVESISVAQTLGGRNRQRARHRIDPNQELIALGAANLGASISGGFPVTGGFARSVVNADAGARTQAAGAFTAIGLAVAALILTPLAYHLPKATLAATIIVAVLALVDLSILRRAWAYSRSDFAAMMVTILVTLLFGVEPGVMAGVGLSLLLHLIKTSRPHVAEVGLVPGTQHFRNIHRHKVQTAPGILTLRIDESLYFANAHFLEDLLRKRAASDPSLRHVILMCSAVNAIDFSALERLEAANAMLREAGIGLHLSEVKGPVMDRLMRTHFLSALNGQVFLSQYEAIQSLTGRNISETS